MPNIGGQHCLKPVSCRLDKRVAKGSPPPPPFLSSYILAWVAMTAGTEVESNAPVRPMLMPFVHSIQPSMYPFGPLRTDLGRAAATWIQSIAGAEAAEVDVIVAGQVQNGQLAAKHRCQEPPCGNHKRQEEHNDGRLRAAHSVRKQLAHDASLQQRC